MPNHDYELAAVEAALAASSSLPDAMFITLNVSPALIRERGRRLRRTIADSNRRLVFELTEHVAIEDFAALRAAIQRLGEGGDRRRRRGGQQRVQAERPGTEGWRYAQRTAIRVRAAFWIVKRTEWEAPPDRRHPAASRSPLTA